MSSQPDFGCLAANVQGLKHPKNKRTFLFKLLKKDRHTVYLLTETHTTLYDQVEFWSKTGGVERGGLTPRQHTQEALLCCCTRRATG